MKPQTTTTNTQKSDKSVKATQEQIKPLNEDMKTHNHNQADYEKLVNEQRNNATKFGK